MVNKSRIPPKESALPGRPHKMPVQRHTLSTARGRGAVSRGIERAVFGLGCFWGAERKFWQLPGVYIDRRRLRGRPHAKPDLP